MVWGCFAGDAVSVLFRIQGTLNQHGYHIILQRYAIPSGLCLVGLSFVFQQDNDPKHTSRLCKVYLTKKDSRQVLSICWKSFRTFGKAFQVKQDERMPIVCKAVIKAKGGYFEDSQI
jgi:hypothetical protein